MTTEFTYAIQPSYLLELTDLLCRIPKHGISQGHRLKASPGRRHGHEHLEDPHGWSAHALDAGLLRGPDEQALREPR